MPGALGRDVADETTTPGEPQVSGPRIIYRWPERRALPAPPCVLAPLLDDVQRYIHRYVVLSTQQAIATTLWVAHCHAFAVAEATPYLNVTSAVKQSGKTRLLEVLEPIVPAAWLTGRVSAAVLTRKVDGETPTLLLECVERFRQRDAQRVGEPLGAQLHVWKEAAVEALRDAEPALPGALSDRAADVWEPLIAIADLAGDDWPARARRAATGLSGEVSVSDDTVSIRLLEDVGQVLTDDTIASADLVRRLVILEDRPWADWTGGRPITQARVARLLRPFGIHPMKLRFGETTANGYTKRMFVDPWSRYLPRKVEQRNTTKNDGDERDTFRVEPDTAGSSSETAVPP